jgi:hypothetical protein
VVIFRLARSVMRRRACATVGGMEPKPPVIDRFGSGGGVRGTGPSQRHPISIPTQRWETRKMLKDWAQPSQPKRAFKSETVIQSHPAR